MFQSGAAEHEVWAPDVFGRYFSFYFRRCWLLPFCFRYSPVWGRIVVLVEALLYIQQPPSGSKASLSRQMTVTDVERPSLPKSATRRVLSIVNDNPVNSLQAVWMPHLRPVLAKTHWFLLRSFLFSSPTPCTTLVISSCRFTSRLMVQEQCVLALPFCGERVLICILGLDSPLWSSPVFSQKHVVVVILAAVWIQLWSLSQPLSWTALVVSCFYSGTLLLSGSGQAL